MWSEAYVPGSEEIIGGALDRTFGGTWYVLLGSTIAFVASVALNNFLNFLVGKAFSRNPDGFTAYAVRAYVSTAVAQFFDNLIFAWIVSHHFFGWTTLQCVTCAATGMLVELLLEVLFSPVGFFILQHWQRRDECQ